MNGKDFLAGKYIGPGDDSIRNDTANRNTCF